MTFYSSNGTAYQISGPETAPVVVLIHGLGLNRQVWDAYEDALGARFRVLSYDLFGHGESPAPPRFPDLGLFADQLIELMDEMGINRAVLAGFSLGGMINRRLAIDHPERVSALIILNSPHERQAEAQALVERHAMESSAGGPAATLDAAIERWFSVDFRDRKPDFIAMVRGWVLANDAEIYAQCRRTLAFGVVELIRPDPPLDLPALVITGENDSGSTPAMSVAIADEISQARVVIMPQMKHMGLVEHPQLFIDQMFGFIDKIPA